MPLTCASWIPVLRPYLAGALVGSRTFSWLESIARQAPGDCLAVLEVRLARGDGPVDFSVRLESPAQALAFAEWVEPAHLRKLLSDWAAHREPLDGVASMWLEFDQAERAPASLVPIVCARLRPDAAEGLLDGILPALHGRPLLDAQRRTVERSLELLPPGGSLLYAFSLLPRPGEKIRLELFGLHPGAMVDYIERLLSKDAARRLAGLAGLIEGGERYHLSFDIGERIEPRLGVEVAFRRAPPREPRWRGLLGRLVEAGLCTQEKRRAVEGWVGYDSLWTVAKAWPAEREALGGYCVRSLSHLKLVTSDDGPPVAKAYLIFQYLSGKRFTPPA